MNIKKLKINVTTILLNYNQILKRTFYFIIYLALVLCISLLITLPLWYLATRHSKVYTSAVIFLFLIVFILTILKYFIKWVNSKQKDGYRLIKIILIPVKKAGVFVLFIISLYIITLSYSTGYLLLAVLLTIIYLFILGYFIFVLRKNTDSH